MKASAAMSTRRTGAGTTRRAQEPQAQGNENSGRVYMPQFQPRANNTEVLVAGFVLGSSAQEPADDGDTIFWPASPQKMGMPLQMRVPRNLLFTAEAVGHQASYLEAGQAPAIVELSLQRLPQEDRTAVLDGVEGAELKTAWTAPQPTMTALRLGHSAPNAEMARERQQQDLGATGRLGRWESNAAHQYGRARAAGQVSQ